MGLNWETNDTYNYVDKKNNMMLHQPYFWDESGKGPQIDAIGRNFISYYCYNDDRFVKGVKNCWIKKDRNWWGKILKFQKYYYQGYRYPIHEDNDLSRDHIIYIILLYKISGISNKEIKEFVTHLRWKISDRYSFTLNTWLWARTLCKIWWATPLYYLIEIPTIIVTTLWNNIIQRIAGYGYKDEVYQKDFVKMQNKDKPKRVIRFNKLMYPVYALHQQAWKIYVLPDSFLKRLMQKLLIKVTPKHNYVIKILLGYKNQINSCDVYDYKPMTSFRWSGILEKWINDRDMEIIKNENLIKFNNIDKDYLIKLYEK